MAMKTSTLNITLVIGVLGVMKRGWKLNYMVCWENPMFSKGAYMKALKSYPFRNSSHPEKGSFDQVKSAYTYMQLGTSGEHFINNFYFDQGGF